MKNIKKLNVWQFATILFQLADEWRCNALKKIFWSRNGIHLNWLNIRSHASIQWDELRACRSKQDALTSLSCWCGGRFLMSLFIPHGLCPFCWPPSPCSISNRLKLVHHAPQGLCQAPGESMHVARSDNLGLGRGFLKQQQGAGGLLLFSKLDAGNLLSTSHSHLLPLLETLPVLRTLWEKKKLLRVPRCFSHFNKNRSCWKLPLVNIKILPWLFSLPQPTIAHIGYQEFLSKITLISQGFPFK